MATTEEQLARFQDEASKIGLDLGYLESPEQGFMRFAQQFDPAYGRRAVYSQQDPLTARWLLRQPTAPGTFSQFLQPGAGMQLTAPDWSGIRARAEQIGALTGMSPTDYFDQLGGAQPAGYAGLTPGEELGYLGTYGFGAGDQAAERQRQLVNLMALQRGRGGGQYQGAMAGAIGNVMNELYQQFALNNPGGNFLNWYLERSGQGGRLSPTLAPTAAAPAAAPAVPTGTAINPY